MVIQEEKTVETGKKRTYILKGVKKSLIYSLIAAGILGAIAALYALFAGKYLFKSIAYAYYYFGAFCLIFSIPQLYKRNEDPKVKKIRKENLLYGFRGRISNPYEEKAVRESEGESKNGGFWFGIFIIIFSFCLFFYGVIMESIYFYYFLGR